MKTPLFIAMAAGLSIALSSAAIEIYQGSATNWAKPGTADKIHYKSTLYVVVDTATGACTVYEAISKAGVQKPAGTLIEVKKQYTKVVNPANTFKPGLYGSFTQVNVPADVRDAGVPGTPRGIADGANSGTWDFTAKGSATFKAPKAERYLPVGPVLVRIMDNGGSLKLNKGLTKDAGNTIASGELEVQALLAKKKYTPL